MNQRRFVRDKIEELGYLHTNAKLIWPRSETETYYDRPQNSYVCFRKKFHLSGMEAGATARVFADSRYVLYINGQYVTKGPARSDPRWQFVDEIDVGKYLREGENLIAAMVLYYGYGTGHSMDSIPCFLFDARIGDASILTDVSWVCKKCDAFRPGAPRVNGCKGPCEIFDCRRYEENWMMADYDDGDWERVRARDVHRLSPFRNLLARPIPLLREERIDAVSVIAVGEGVTASEESTERLHHAIKAECGYMRLDPVCRFLPLQVPPPSSAERFSVVCVDFGRVLTGYLRLGVNGHEGDVVDVIFAEVKTPDLRPFVNVKTYRPLSRFILREGSNDLQVFFNYDAMRYAYLVFRGENAELCAASMSWVTYPMDRMSSFTTEEPRLQKLWDISAHTLRLCMQDGFLDSPSREQQQWMGDARCQARFNAYLSGDMRMLQKILYQFAQSQDYEGMTCSRYPDQNINLAPIPDFCLQWLGAFEDYYDFTGDLKPASDLYDHMIRAVRWFTAFLGEDGLLWNMPYWQYYDTGFNALGQRSDYEVGEEGCACAVDNLMLLEAVGIMLRFARLLDDAEAIEFYGGFYQSLFEACKKAFWSEKKGCMIDCIRPTRPSESVSELVNALALLHLFAPHSPEAEAILRNVFGEGARDTVVRADFYSSSTVVRALVKHGAGACAIRLMLDLYAETLSEEADATSTWETRRLFLYDDDGNVTWQHSACHAWGAVGLLIGGELLGGVRYESGVPVLDDVPTLVPFEAEICMPGNWRLICQTKDGKLIRRLIRE
ncbi:MAG: family 78 glycoside hydrolase catalytic domain [Clostridia bacterium]|nr:family 78 glycoside hydrolase catalytic domain [Clostridia bacterium]